MYPDRDTLSNVPRSGAWTNFPSIVIRLERRASKGSLSGRVMRLVPVFMLETQNQTNYKMFVQVRPDG